MSLLLGPRTLRSRWSTLLWAGSVCLFAVSVAREAEDGDFGVDAATAPTSNAAQASALAAEDGD